MRRARRGARPRRTHRGTVRAGNEAGADAAALECRDLREWISGGRRARVPGGEADKDAIATGRKTSAPFAGEGEFLEGTSLFLGDLPLHGGDPVLRVDVDERRAEVRQFLLVVRRVIGDDDPVPLAYLARGGAVQADHPRIALSLDDVGGEPVPVVDVVDVDLFVLHQSRRLH